MRRRTFVTALAGVACAALAVVVGRTSRGSAGPRVVFFGDSITASWVTVAPKFFSNRDYIDCGVGGQTTTQLAARFAHDALGLQPQVVVILAGTNDIAGNGGPISNTAILANLVAMTDAARANGVRVVLASVLPVLDYPWNKGLHPAPIIVALNVLVKEHCVRRHLVYLDYYSSMVDGRGGLRQNLTDDGVHPNKSGYDVMAPLADSAIREALRAA